MSVLIDHLRTQVASAQRLLHVLLAQRDASSTPTVSVAASDFYGPLVRNAHAGERLVPTVLTGRTMRLLGSADQPHSFTYVPDLAAAMITAARRPELWNSFLHAPTAPAITQRRLVELVAAAGGVAVISRSGQRRDGFDDIGSLGHQDRAFLQQAVGARGAGVERRAGYGEYQPADLAGEPGADQRSRAFGCLDHDQPEG